MYRRNRLPPPMKLIELIKNYENSPKYQKLAESSQYSYQNNLSKLSSLFQRDISTIEKYEICTISSGMNGGAHNLFISSARIIFDFAIDRGFLDSNPVKGIKNLPSGEWEPWPYDTLRRLLDTPHFDCFILAANFAFYTAQRISDILDLRWKNLEDGYVNLKQRKTGTSLRIPIHADLARVLPEPGEPDDHIIKYKGKPIKRSNFSVYFRKRALEEVGVYYPCHGIRKTSAQRMAEAGATVHQIQSITGHRSLRQVAHYTKGADQKFIAEEAVRFLK
jgi:integrase